MAEPERFGNASESALEPTERRQIIEYTLILAREYLRIWSREITVQEVELHMDGKRQL